MQPANSGSIAETVVEFLSQYGMFLLKTLTIVIAIVFVVGFIAHSKQAHKPGAQGSIQFTNLSDDFQQELTDLKQGVLSKEAFKEYQKQQKKKAKDKSNQEQSANLFVVEFDGDMKASAVSNLREEISAILMIADTQDQVMVKLKSPGGMVHTYGLAASQLRRVRDAGIELTACVDEVAASGGYMMACVADKICAAPFAIIGSIGVLGQLPNFNKLLKKNAIEFEQHTAGEFKRTLTMLGENTDEGRTKFKQELEETHQLFKAFINHNRPQLDVDKVATGEHWYGQQAIDLDLVDEITTSDDWLLQRLQQEAFQVFQVKYEHKKALAERLSEGFVSAISNASEQVSHKVTTQKLFKV